MVRQWVAVADRCHALRQRLSELRKLVPGQLGSSTSFPDVTNAVSHWAFLADLGYAERCIGYCRLCRAWKRDIVAKVTSYIYRIDDYFDVRLDEKVTLRSASFGSTPRTIEGRFTSRGARQPWRGAHRRRYRRRRDPIHGREGDGCGTPIPGATVEVWDADTLAPFVLRQEPEPLQSSSHDYRRHRGAYRLREHHAVRLRLSSDGSTCNNSSTCSTVTAAVRLISCLWRRAGIPAARRRRSTSRAIDSGMTTSLSPPVTSSFPR